MSEELVFAIGIVCFTIVISIAMALPAIWDYIDYKREELKSKSERKQKKR